MSEPTPLDYFSALVRPGEHLPLLESAICLAQDEFPDLDVQQVLTDLDTLLLRVKNRLAPNADGLQRLKSLNQFFFRELGFGGNYNDFYNPRNSFVHEVLRTRRGIPISLAVIWLELAQGLGLRAHGVAFPGHFLVKVNLPKGQVVIDPVNGQSLSREELVERLEPFRYDLSPKLELEPPLGLYLQACSPRDMLVRMLRNLKEVYRTQEEWPRALRVCDRLVVLLPKEWAEWRDRGLMQAENGNPAQAVLDLETYVAHADGEPDVRAIALRLADLRQIRN
jgi:regulator of sirC expression with transglutaminase-like and TPR domain